MQKIRCKNKKLLYNFNQFWPKNYLNYNSIATNIYGRSFFQKRHLVNKFSKLVNL